jgi:hypothetical protein
VARPPKLLHRGASGVRTALDSFGKQFGFGVPPKKFLKIVVSRAGFVAADPFKFEAWRTDDRLLLPVGGDQYSGRSELAKGSPLPVGTLTAALRMDARDHRVRAMRSTASTSLATSDAAAPSTRKPVSRQSPSLELSKLADPT